MRDGAVMSIEDVRSAAEVIAGVAHRTPVLTSRTLDRCTGGSVMLKAENLQRSGSFKFRGAYNTICRLPAGRGVVAYSSGNHAQAVALAAALQDRESVIVMPHDAPTATSDTTAVRITMVTLMPSTPTKYSTLNDGIHTACWMNCRPKLPDAIENVLSYAK